MARKNEVSCHDGCTTALLALFYAIALAWFPVLPHARALRPPQRLVSLAHPVACSVQTFPCLERTYSTRIYRWYSAIPICAPLMGSLPTLTAALQRVKSAATLQPSPFPADFSAANGVEQLSAPDIVLEWRREHSSRLTRRFAVSRRVCSTCQRPASTVALEQCAYSAASRPALEHSRNLFTFRLLVFGRLLPKGSSKGALVEILVHVKFLRRESGSKS